jgi:hypothetical protein
VSSYTQAQKETFILKWGRRLTDVGADGAEKSSFHAKPRRKGKVELVAGEHHVMSN